MKRYIALLASALGIWGVVVISGQQAAGPFTADQATAGSATYQTSCAGCHGPDLAGRNDAPALAGQMFVSDWGREPRATWCPLFKARCLPAQRVA